VTHLAAVPVPDLLRWASQVHDEVGLDDVADGLRAAAEDPDLDVFETLHRVRAAGSAHCGPRNRCSYHEGWHDALDLLEDELP
jgi:hypothetical protein